MHSCGNYRYRDSAIILKMVFSVETHGEKLEFATSTSSSRTAAGLRNTSPHTSFSCVAWSAYSSAS